MDCLLCEIAIQIIRVYRFMSDYVRMLGKMLTYDVIQTRTSVDDLFDGRKNMFDE